MQVQRTSRFASALYTEKCHILFSVREGVGTQTCPYHAWVSKMADVTIPYSNCNQDIRAKPFSMMGEAVKLYETIFSTQQRFSLSGFFRATKNDRSNCD